MGGIIQAVLTVDAQAFWPQMFAGANLVGGTTPFKALTGFKLGEGGWINATSGQVPRTPDPTLRRLTAPLIQDLDAIVDTTRPAAQQRYPGAQYSTPLVSFGVGDIEFVSPSSIQCRCFIDAPQFNTDNDAVPDSPNFWEIGIFSDHPTIGGQSLMVAYGTFPLVVKTNARQFESMVLITVST